MNTITGILDVQGKSASLLAEDGERVSVPLSLVRKHGLRRGDTVGGPVDTRFALSEVDSLNGGSPENSRNRPEFTSLTPIHPDERLRLETEPHRLTNRVIDLVMPVGKGQRALIVAPPKAGKTTVLQDIAHGISKNHPECHLMAVLVGERPEEVTDIQRSMPGEVMASTFDRPPAEHISVAELAIERAKRLVESGRDVVVLLDSLTRLGRAYNLAAPGSGRVLSGGIDVSALHPPKRFLGAARNIEGGGSLTIFATALVETGSLGDGVTYEEFKGTGNAELKLDRRTAGRRVFPAVDIEQSSTRREDLLLTPEELVLTRTLRRALNTREHNGIDQLLDGLRKAPTNAEFLLRLAAHQPH
ncbi:transcription termination factor Rho [Allokutzneria sp. NRRL B-24872]|uniref:transcription termination factor Rho n=1 Tax=Allokutzneria sp. NRRL B-24872 TaxID=1137961 RepID=UPI000A383AFF